MQTWMRECHCASVVLAVPLWPVSSYIGGLGVFLTVLTLLVHLGGTLRASIGKTQFFF